MTTIVMAATVTAAIGLAISAFARPIVVHLERLWANAYTRLAPTSAGHDRRRDIDAEHHDQVAEGRTLGYKPGEIAFHIAWRWVMGIPDDVMWGVRELLAAREDTMLSACGTIQRRRWRQSLVRGRHRLWAKPLSEKSVSDDATCMSSVHQ